MSKADWALLFHLLGAFLLVSGIVVAGVAFEAARRRERPAEIALLLGLTRIGVALVGAGTLVLLAFGLWLVHLERIGFDAAWVDASIVLFAAVAVLGALGGQRPKRARKLATRLAAAHAGSSRELRHLLDDPVSLALNYLSAVLTLAIVVLMVWQPG